jgi:hypothetical protein
MLLVGGWDGDVIHFADAWFLQFPTDTTISAASELASAVVDEHGAHLRWSVSADTTATLTVERSSDALEWQPAGSAHALDSDTVTYDDPGLLAGKRAAYRLLVESPGRFFLTAAAWVQAPLAPTALTLAPIVNPQKGALAIHFTLAQGVPAQLQLLDIAGRLEEDVKLPAGSTSWTLRTPRAAGIYFVRLSQSGAHRVRRLIAVR